MDDLTTTEARNVARGDVAERQTTCCSFFTFPLDGADDGFTMSISLSSERCAILDAVVDRAEERSA